MTRKNIHILLLTVLLIISCDKLSPFAGKPSLPKTMIPLPTYYSIDSINDFKILNIQEPIKLSLNQNFTVTGWAVDILAKDAAGGVIIDIDGKLYSAHYGGDRKDVANFYKMPTYEYSMFIAQIPASIIGPGKHVLSIKILTKDKSAYYSTEQRVLFEIN